MKEEGDLASADAHNAAFVPGSETGADAGHVSPCPRGSPANGRRQTRPQEAYPRAKLQSRTRGEACRRRRQPLLSYSTPSLVTAA